jgi:hypothetical protein
MKKTLYLAAGLIFSNTAHLPANIILNTEFGIAYNSTGTAVPDGTLWVMIVDDGDNLLPGGLAANSSLGGSNLSQILADFQEDTVIELGLNINGDTVFAFGGINGLDSFSIQGYNNEVLDLALNTNGLETGRSFGYYWFPGIQYTGSNPLLANLLEVGGITDISDSDPLLRMVIPGDGNTSSPTALTTSLDGTFSDARFTAVAIPEPSAAALAVLGAVAALRRRRA